MAAAIDLRSDFDGDGLRRIARASKDGRQVRRLLALAAIYDGGARSEAARIGGVGLQIVRDWVVRFNDRGPDGLIDGKAPGALSLLSAEQRHALLRIVEVGPIPASQAALAKAGWAVATDRPCAMGLGRVRALDQQADAEPRASRIRLSQTLRPPAPSYPGYQRHPRF